MVSLRKLISSPVSAAAVIDRLQRDLDRIERRVRMLHSYERITPYVVEHEQYGTTFSFIVYHKESEAWFGKPYLDGNIRDSRHLLRSTDVAFDFGCNSGYHAVWMALNAQQGHVFAYDPFPWNAVATRAQALLNRCDNITVHDYGVGDADRSLDVTTYSSKTFNADTFDQTFPVTVRKVEALRRHRPQFLKIDIEGAEAELATTTLLRWPSIRAGYVEMHPEFIAPTGRDPRAFLVAAGEAGFNLVQGGAPVASPVQEVVATAYMFERNAPPVPRSTGRMSRQARDEATEFFAQLPGRLASVTAGVRDDVMVHVDYLAEKAGMTREALLSGKSMKVLPQILADALHNIRAVLANAVAAATTRTPAVPEVIALAEAALQGWCTREKAMAIAEIVTTERPRLCVEIGVYGGRSLVPAAAALRANGEGVIYGIETWRPDVAIEHATNDENDAWWRKLDFGAIKTAFLKFVADNGLAMQVRLIEAPSADAASLFGAIDYLHIDGAHSTYNAAEDVVLYARKVRPGGIIIMDDTNWTTTAPAVAILDAIADRVRSFPDEHGNAACIVFRKR